MPKGGSGFMRAAGNVARAIGSGGDWTLYNQREAIQGVQSLYGKTYRNNDVSFTYDGRGRLKEIGGKNFDRFAVRAEALAKQLAKDVRVIDRDAERQYREMQRYVGKIRTTEAERREFRDYYQGESHLNPGASRSGGDASEAARQMRDRGLFTADTQNMGNVDILVAIHREMNAVKGRIYSSVPASQRDVFEADIFEGLTSRYEGVVKSAAKRRRS